MDYHYHEYIVVMVFVVFLLFYDVTTQGQPIGQR